MVRSGVGIGYVRPVQFLDHLTVIIRISSGGPLKIQIGAGVSNWNKNRSPPVEVHLPYLLVTTGFDLKLFDGAILISIRKFGNSVSLFLD